MSRQPHKGASRKSRAKAPTGAIESVDFSDRGAQIIVRLNNPANRAMHYITDLRSIRYDTARRRLVLGLSDRGSEAGTAAFRTHPQFAYIDPASAAELKLQLLASYVQFDSQVSASGDLLFTEIRPASAREIVVEIAWSDVPFYDDPRDRPEDVDPTIAWALGEVAMSIKMPTRKGNSS